jgi:hypothetical protein
MHGYNSVILAYDHASHSGSKTIQKLKKNRPCRWREAGENSANRRRIVALCGVSFTVSIPATGGVLFTMLIRDFLHSSGEISTEGCSMARRISSSLQGRPHIVLRKVPLFATRTKLSQTKNRIEMACGSYERERERESFKRFCCTVIRCRHERSNAHHECYDKNKTKQS